MVRDKDRFSSLLDFVGAKVSYHIDLKFRTEKQSIVLIDEFDVLLTQDPIVFCNAIKKLNEKNVRIIGFTATLFGTEDLEY